MFICCYNWLPEFGEISLHVIKIILLKINSIDFMMRYKNVQYVMNDIQYATERTKN